MAYIRQTSLLLVLAFCKTSRAKPFSFGFSSETNTSKVKPLDGALKIKRISWSYVLSNVPNAIQITVFRPFLS